MKSGRRDRRSLPGPPPAPSAPRPTRLGSRGGADRAAGVGGGKGFSGGRDESPEDVASELSIPVLLQLPLRPTGQASLLLPGFYAFCYNPPDQGIRLLVALYSHALDPRGDSRIDHRAGYRSEPGVCIVDRFFAAGFEEGGDNSARLAYVASHVDLRDLVCTTREDLHALYRNILKSRIN